MILSILLALAGGASAPAASASSIEAYRQLPVCQLAPDGRRLLREPCRTAPPRAAMPRRPVPQIITPTPPVAAAPDPRLSWAPILTPAAPLAPAPGVLRAAPAGSSPGPSAPIPVTCDAGGCRDPSGAYYHGPPGQVIGPAGRVCTHNGVWMTCF